MEKEGVGRERKVWERRRVKGRRRVNGRGKGKRRKGENGRRKQEGEDILSHYEILDPPLLADNGKHTGRLIVGATVGTLSTTAPAKCTEQTAMGGWVGLYLLYQQDQIAVPGMQTHDP